MNANMLQGLVMLLLGLALRKRWQSPAALSPDARGLWLLAGMGALHFAAALLAVKSVYWASFLGIVAALYWSLRGAQVFYRSLSWFLFALFLLPQIPAELQTPLSLQLQHLSTQLTAAMAGLFIPITTSGNIFFIEGEAYEVTVACSGLHTWIGFLFAGLLWQVFEPFSLRRLGVTLALAPLLALLFNSLRLFVTALVAYNVSPDAGMAIHTNVEYLLFPLGLVLMLALGRKLDG